MVVISLRSRRLNLEWLEERRCLTDLSFSAHVIDDGRLLSEAFDFEVADLDADGRDDLLVAGRNALRVMFDPGQMQTRWSRESTAVAAVDIDGDAAIDIVVQERYSNQLRLLINQGERVFSNSDAALVAHHFVFGDLDSDGDADAVLAVEDCTANDGSCTNLIRAFENLGAFEFRHGPLLDIQHGLKKLALDDIDGNGTLDLLTFTSRCDAFDGFCDHRIRWFANRGGALERGGSIGSLPGEVEDIVMVDFDADGDNDVAVLTKLGGVSWLERRDDQVAFSPPHVLRTEVQATPHAIYPFGSLAVADFDGDSDLDLIPASRNPIWRFGWFEWIDADTGFRAESPLELHGGEPPIYVAAGDFDGDGDTDIGATTNRAQRIWLENETARQRTPGDINRDGLFNSADLVLALQAGEYEDTLAGNSVFDEGDWNGDGDFTSADLVFVFQLGIYTSAALPLTLPATR